MYKMIGGDGREYGPVTADQLREWILDHRADGRTEVQPEGRTDWVALGSLPEFAEDLAEAARRHGAPVAPPPIPVGAAPAAELRILDCLGRAWLMLQRHALLITLGGLIVWLIPTGLAMLGCWGVVGAWVVSGALYGGYTVLLLNLARARPAALGDVFVCFRGRFLPCMLVWLVTEFLTQAGLMLCLLPGVFIAVVWAFSLPLVADRDADVGGALRESWKAVLPRFFPVLGVLTLAFLPTLVFAAYAFVSSMGIAVRTLGPAGVTSLAEMMEKLPAMLQEASVLGFQQHLVLLLNLPFAWAALVSAYETLFNPGPQPRA